MIWLIGVVIAIGYPDTAILFFLGAREIRSGDESKFFEAAAQQAYKLVLPVPKLYFYSGGLERGFVLLDKNVISLVLSRSFIEHADSEELSAVCFELLLQVKKGMAHKRTKVMLILGMIAWVSHGVMGLIKSLIPFREIGRVADWVLAYFLQPWLEFIFELTLGKNYFKKLQNHLAYYPGEQESLRRVGLKLRRRTELYSVPSKKLLEFSSIIRSRSFQNILALELLPHEWDLLFGSEDLMRAKKN
jgi:hypothetical protein